MPSKVDTEPLIGVSLEACFDLASVEINRVLFCSLNLMIESWIDKNPFSTS